MSILIKNSLIFIIGLLVVAYICIGILLYVKQRDMLYFPQVYKQTLLPSINIKVDDATINIIQLTENSFVNVSDIKQIKPVSNQKKAIIYFGGNAEAVVNSADIFTPLVSKYDIYLVNYRGYGTSTGQITEQNNYQDAQAVYDIVKQTHLEINVVGRSIGTGVASYLAEKNEVNKLVLITPYDSILHVAQSKLPIYPINILLKDTYPSIKRAPNISSNTLILSAQNDEMIPITHAENLAQAFQTVDYQEISQSNHNDIMTKKSALRKFWSFLNPS